jgi:two-component system, sensor histidine kinase and response regulator
MKGKILVLEDNSTILQNLTELLEEEDFKVYPGANGIAGIALLKQNKPDLILCDITMPDMNGIEFYQYVKDDYNTKFIPFIFLTAKTDLFSIRAGLNLGADDYITKPFTAGDLLKAVETRLRKSNDYNAQFGSLIKNISMYIPHELRTPLVSIMGYSQLIISDIDVMEKNEIKKTVERIAWSAHRLHSRIEKFIAYSDLELIESETKAGQSNVITDITDTLVTNIVLGHYFLNERAHLIKTQIEPAKLNIPQILIMYMLKELLENAVKYSPDDSEVIVQGKKGTDEYCFAITDYGIGMEKEEIDNIGVFRQFSREDHSQEGNGLGLAICKKVVQLNNGKMSVESEKNKSTTVKISFPI